MIIPNYFEDIHTLHQGTQPNRAYYIPASIPMDCLVEHREQSDRFQLLNGQWKFRYCESVHDFSEPFLSQTLTAVIGIPSRFPAFGRTTALTSISIPISDILSRRIPPMFPTKIPAVHICGSLPIHPTKRLPRSI